MQSGSINLKTGVDMCSGAKDEFAKRFVKTVKKNVLRDRGKNKAKYCSKRKRNEKVSRQHSTPTILPDGTNNSDRRLSTIIGNSKNEPYCEWKR